MSKLICILMAGFALVTANAQTVAHEEQQTTTEIQSGRPSHAERKAHERTIKSEAKEDIVRERHKPEMRMNHTEFRTRNVSEFRLGHRPHFNIVTHDRVWYVNQGYEIVMIEGCPYYFDAEVNGFVPAFGFEIGCTYPDNFVVYYNY